MNELWIFMHGRKVGAGEVPLPPYLSTKVFETLGLGLDLRYDLDRRYPVRGVLLAVGFVKCASFFRLPGEWITLSKKR
jgi:hypothetical protein